MPHHNWGNCLIIRALPMHHQVTPNKETAQVSTWLSLLFLQWFPKSMPMGQSDGHIKDNLLKDQDIFEIQNPRFDG